MAQLKYMPTTSSTRFILGSGYFILNNKISLYSARFEDPCLCLSIAQESGGGVEYTNRTVGELSVNDRLTSYVRVWGIFQLGEHDLEGRDCSTRTPQVELMKQGLVLWFHNLNTIFKRFYCRPGLVEFERKDLLQVKSSRIVLFSNAEECDIDEFDRYTMNDIPTCLICLTDMTFVERNEVREHFRTSYIKCLGHPSNTIRYAILSHRWLNQGELTYEEIKAGTAAGPGYEKLKKFCAKAEDYNMEFAWLDTCCINKSSSTELDESICSMFKWYGNSAICIVHLAQSETIEDIMEDERD
ncbi:heterokaryon incompatibility protein-domain-containing protein [Suillus americanus]|nr:heterokaryon incompatibility protein-domain-containing protein [Suillus americanus]